MRDRTLTAYGSADDQAKLAVLAEQAGETVSTWIIKQIQQNYARLYGEMDPQLLRKSG